jgi:hypothetical protein
MSVLEQNVEHQVSVRWGEFASQASDLAEFGSQRLAGVPAHLVTVDASGAPRVHPVTPILGNGR